MNINLKISYHITAKNTFTKFYFSGISFTCNYYAWLNNSSELHLETFSRFENSSISWL
jgi:hypothetical protein